MKSGFYNMDCMEGMSKFPDKFFDLAIVDPPYGIGLQSMNYTKAEKRKTYGHMAAKRRDYIRTDTWDIRPSQDYFDELMRVSKHQVIWGGNYFSDMLPPSKSFICWDKRCNNEMTNAFADCEVAWTDAGVARMFRYIWNGMMQGKSIDEGYITKGNKTLNEKRIHPTQKPVALYTWILRTYAKPGYRILDTHVGSASSLIACYRAGFEYWGFEIDIEYFRIANERLESEKSQINVFSIDEEPLSNVSINDLIIP